MKSLRFARRAIELYEEGLSKWPRNLDLAYNKARLELEIATHPLLAKCLDVPVIDVMYQSLRSHEYALSLDQDNADALFNAGQVLTSIAEHVAKDDDASDTEALNYLQQALEYQDRCLLLQKDKYAETQRIHDKATGQEFESDDDDGGAKVDSGTTTTYEDRGEQEQWFSVVEPVTANTLVDTILAQLSTLTTLCSILNGTLDAPGPSSVPLSWVEACSNNLIDMLETITKTEDITSRANEIALVKAIFAGNLLELGFRSRSIDISTYKNELEKAFAVPDLESSADAQVAYARSLLALNGAVGDTSTNIPSELDTQSYANACWNALSKAQKLLTTAARISNSDTETLATTHMLRGDTSLLLFALSYPPMSFAQAMANAPQLLKNAEVFYRNANKLLSSLGQEGQEEQAAAAFRGGIVEVLQSQPSDASDMAATEKILLSASKGKSDEWRRRQLQDMIDEGLVKAEVFGMT